jgi:hypothetical protein
LAQFLFLSNFRLPFGHLFVKSPKLKEEDIFGFYELEFNGDQPFRWSSTVAAVRLQLEPDDYEVTVQLSQVRLLIPRQELSIFLNGVSLSGVTFDPDEFRLEFFLPKDALGSLTEQWLIFVCLPWSLPAVKLSDERSLGLPLVAVSFEPGSSSINPF